MSLIHFLVKSFGEKARPVCPISDKAWLYIAILAKIHAGDETLSHGEDGYSSRRRAGSPGRASITPFAAALEWLGVIASAEVPIANDGGSGEDGAGAGRNIHGAGAYAARVQVCFLQKEKIVPGVLDDAFERTNSGRSRCAFTAEHGPGLVGTRSMHQGIFSRRPTPKFSVS